ncbi:MBOAT family O-acyltransferase [Flagellimonas taeanensis]|uniref:MBOAT family O-acyltransferase n=1 Tax=Flagellimonas taeanensis TaxID=1005926 RepID=UPI0015A54179|nr:MBOAT family protein [Allomuricauda taeanensis]
MLVIGSFVFYGWWDWRFLFLIIFSGLVDFVSAILINRYRNKARIFLVLSILVNVGILGVFKYSSFIAEQIDHLFQFISYPFSLKDKIPGFALILPVGISFYTFQSMSYTIDVYRGKLEPTKNILHFFSYLAMFPQLVAGPIVRAKDFLKQLKVNRKVSAIEFWNGIKLIIIGYFQKTVLADNLGVLVDNAFAGIDNGMGIYWWIVMSCFAFQIYFDFNGYSQIARGLAKLMGYHFKMNFNHPYIALSLKDFWTRWHISLSTWFRDYVYIPLGGSKKGEIRSHANMWVTMTLSGLWHGAQINFILWGMYHSAALSIERLANKFFTPIFKLNFSILKWSATLFAVLVGWVFFRASSIDQIVFVLNGMFTPNLNFDFLNVNKDPILFLVIAILIEIVFIFLKNNKILKRVSKNLVVETLTYAILICSILFLRGPEKEFIYFQF